MAGSGCRKISPWAYHGQSPVGNLNGSKSGDVDLCNPSVIALALERVLDKGFAFTNVIKRIKEADIPIKITDNIRKMLLVFIFPSLPDPEGFKKLVISLIRRLL